MIRSNDYSHIEYLYPDDRFKDFWLRIILTAIACSFLLGIYIKIILMGIKETGFLMILVTLTAIVPLVTIWLVRDFVRFLRSFQSHKSRLRVVISRIDIRLLVGNRLIQRMKWDEIDIIEKVRYHNESVILLIKDILGEEPIMCDARLNNYIMLPHRLSLDNAIMRLSNRKVELTPPGVNRFVNVK